MSIHSQESITVEPESVPQCGDEDQEVTCTESHDPKIDEMMRIDVEHPVEAQSEVMRPDDHSEILTNAKDDSERRCQPELLDPAQEAESSRAEDMGRQGMSDIATSMSDVQLGKVPDTGVADNGVPGNEESDVLVSST